MRAFPVHWNTFTSFSPPCYNGEQLSPFELLKCILPQINMCYAIKTSYLNTKKSSSKKNQASHPFPIIYYFDSRNCSCSVTFFGAFPQQKCIGLHYHFKFMAIPKK